LSNCRRGRAKAVAGPPGGRRGVPWPKTVPKQYGRNGPQLQAQRSTGGDGFWDRPVLINLLADLLLLGGGVLLAWAATMALQRLPVFPLRQLVVATPVEQVSRAQIEYTARGVRCRKLL
jgi:hypothetical protein